MNMNSKKKKGRSSNQIKSTKKTARNTSSGYHTPSDYFGFNIEDYRHESDNGYYLNLTAIDNMAIDD